MGTAHSRAVWSGLAVTIRFASALNCALQTLFALTLMELAEFEWRRPEGHGWEVGRWPGLRLTLLAQPESGPHRVPLAICPLPGNDNEIPFILLISLRHTIDSAY